MSGDGTAHFKVNAMSIPSKAASPASGYGRGDNQIVKWIPTFDSTRFGIELLGPPLRGADVGGRLRSIHVADPQSTAFLIVRLAVFEYDDLLVAVTQAVSVSLTVKVCFSVDHRALPLINADLLAHENVIFMLEISEENTPLSALTSDAIAALRIDPDLAGRLSSDTRGALLLEMLRNLAKEIGLASFGPWLQEGFGVPIKFDYVPEEAVNDVLSKHRLR